MSSKTYSIARGKLYCSAGAVVTLVGEIQPTAVSHSDSALLALSPFGLDDGMMEMREQLLILRVSREIARMIGNKEQKLEISEKIIEMELYLGGEIEDQNVREGRPRNMVKVKDII